MADSGAKDNIEQDIRKLVADILETEPDDIDGDARFVQDLGMDSMMALEILAGLEKRYRIVIPEESLAKFVNLNATIKIVEELLGKKE